MRSTAAVRRAHRRRRVARYSPWHLSSFGDPVAGDDPAGDDPVIRQAAIQALGNWNGSVVVVDPNTGRILTVVNQKLALSGAFTPCSTFKPVVALAALKEGIISPKTELRVFSRARMNLTEALAHSNNVFFGKLGSMLGFQRVSEYAHEFGLGERAGWDIPDESAGSFPSAPPKEGGVSLLTWLGQDIEMTPLQLAAIVSSIANGGTLYYLQYPRTADELAHFEPKVRRRLVGFDDYFADVKAGMAAAVSYGTARSAYDPEDQIFGKTGTCSEDGARLGWFASYSNEAQPKYAVVVLLRGGRMMFGPHAAEIAGKVYRDLHEKEKTLQAGNPAVRLAGAGQAQ
ncbi:MAG TPA: penicillin-binding transpeptidase domain-containing protein [Terriglobia bacterium]|nr:penicillin-binding transpeptidase domain-containing protein [Terriglobia bacterium]